MISKKSRYTIIGSYNIDTAVFTNKGGRAVNEDCVICTELQSKKNIMLSAVADGLGAHGGGDVASRTAVNTAKEETEKLSRLSKRTVERIFDVMNRAVIKKHSAGINMKTTFAGVFIEGKKIILANIGDTRIYQFTKSRLTGVTVDHSVSYDEVIKAGGTLDDIRGHPMRHILKAAIGVEALQKPDIYIDRLRVGQAYLICSDGFWELVTEEEMETTLSKCTSAKRWLRAMCTIHRKKAGRWQDNYSAVCIIIS